MIGACNVDSQVCAACGEGVQRLSLEVQSFTYGDGEDEVRLEARVPVWTCENCGLQVTDESAEERRHEAVCEHLGRLAPGKIRQMRADYGMTQDQFAELTGIGVASIKRWELGNQIQSDSSDKYLRLVRIPANATILMLGSVGGWGRREPTFRTDFTAGQLGEAGRFRLRPLRPGSGS